MTTSHDATFYVQLTPDVYRPYSGGDDRVRAIKAAALHQGRPKNPIGGGVVVKLTIRVPDAAFLPLLPEAVIEVTQDMVLGTPLEVQALSMEESA